MRRDLATRFIDGRWIVDVSLLLPATGLKAVQAFIIRSQESRLRSLHPLSDRYASCLKTIEAARAGRIEQRLVDEFGGTKGDLVAFSAKQDRKVYQV